MRQALFVHSDSEVQLLHLTTKAHISSLLPFAIPHLHQLEHSIDNLPPTHDPLCSRQPQFGRRTRAVCASLMQQSVMQQQQQEEQRGSVVVQPAASLPSSSLPAPRTRRQLPYVLLYLLPLASLVYLLVLPQHPLIAQKIYTDENAWAADGAREAITASHVRFAQQVQAALMAAEANSAAATHTVRDMIARTWRDVGVDVHTYRHHHSAGGRWSGSTSELTYGVIPSRMGDGKEAVALVVDYNPRHARAAAAHTSMSAVAVVSGLAHYLLGVSWLARDVLLIAVESDDSKQKAVDALGGWLNTYRSPSLSLSHQRNVSLLSCSSPCSSFTFHRSGSILAALCLDIPLDTSLSSTFTLHVGGLYGLSPNLDIVSVILQMLHRRGLSVSIADTLPPHSPLSSSSASVAPHWMKDEYKGLLRSMIQHVTGEATGFHGHFIANNIDAVTLQAVPPLAHTHGRSHQSSAGFTGPLLVALDTFCHSLNNLIEKLHHSTWLYLLVSPTHFVTMSKYVYAFVLLAAPLPLLALMRLYGSGEKRWIQAGGVAVCLYAIGWSVVAAGVLMRGVSGTVAQAAVVLSTAGGSALCGVTVTSWWRSSGQFDWRTLQAIVLLTTFFIVSPLAILNFSLSIALLSCIIPLAVHVRPVKPAVHRWSTLLYQLTRASQLVILLLWSPVTLLAIYVGYWRLGVGIEAMRAVLDGLSHMDNVLYLLVPGVYLPVYVMCWILWLLPSSAADEPAASAAVTSAEKEKKIQ